jgi:Iap family predicted aminopeptidase
MLDYSSVIPGSAVEDEIFGKVISDLRESLDWVKSLLVPVLKWSYECSIETGNKVSSCILLPYSSGLHGEFKHGDFVWIRDPREILFVDVKGKVIILRQSLDEKLLRLVVYLAVVRGASGLLLTSEQRGVLKASVVVGSPGYSYVRSLPVSIPVVAVPLDPVDLSESRGVVIRVKANVEESRGRIIIGGLNGKGDKEVHIIGHHDTILGGFKSTSTRLLLELARDKAIRELSKIANVVFISYTARELGDPELREYNYTWGERYLLKIIAERGGIENILYSIALGPLIYGRSLEAWGHPLLLKPLVETRVARGENTALLESHPYIEHGVPSITLTNRESLIYRNTNLQISEDSSTTLLRELVNTITYLTTHLEPLDNWVNVLRRHAYERVGEAILEARIEVTRLLDIAQREGFRGVYKATRLSHNLLYAACIDPLEYYLDSSMWAGLSWESIKGLERLLEGCRGLLFIGSEEGYVSYPSVIGFIEDVLRGVRGITLKKLKTRIDNELIKSTLTHLGKGGFIG